MNHKQPHLHPNPDEDDSRRARRVVFFGDSITDAGRGRETQKPNEALGSGYAMLAAAQILAACADDDWQFWNRGIGGHRVYDLEARLQNDVLALKPEIVSILIGINDTWRRYDSGVISSIDDFAASYERMVAQLVEAAVSVMILEPFLLPVPEDRRLWREDLNPRLEACRDIARKFGTPYIPLDGLFAQASTRREASFWLPDGVHPSLAGHALIARAWLEALESSAF